MEKLLMMWGVGEDDTKGRAVPKPTSYYLTIPVT